MTHSVQNQRSTDQVAQPGLVEQPRIPRGVGEIPTTVESAEGQQPYQQGYIETAFYFIKDWVVSAFKKIFSCWFSKAISPGLGEPPPSPQPPTLRASIVVDVRFLEAFNRLTDLQKERVCREIGKEHYSFFSQPWNWKTSFEQIGEAIVTKNPTVLERYMHFVPNPEQLVV